MPKSKPPRRTATKSPCKEPSARPTAKPTARSSASPAPERLIAHEWQGYRDSVVPADAPQVQIDATRHAFFAGATAAWGRYMQIIWGSDPEVEDVSPDEARQLELMQEELEAFLAVQTGERETSEVSADNPLFLKKQFRGYASAFCARFSAMQRDELRLGFMGGAMTLMRVLCDKTNADGGEYGPLAEAAFDALADELEPFAQGMVPRFLMASRPAGTA